MKRYEVRISEFALRKILAYAKLFDTECHGFLLGRTLVCKNFRDYEQFLQFADIYDAFLVDSKSNNVTNVIRGTELRDYKKNNYGGVYSIVGMWHSHCYSEVFHSKTDLQHIKSYFPSEFQSIPFGNMHYFADDIRSKGLEKILREENGDILVSSQRGIKYFYSIVVNKGGHLEAMVFYANNFCEADYVSGEITDVNIDNQKVELVCFRDPRKLDTEDLLNDKEKVGIKSVPHTENYFEKLEKKSRKKLLKLFWDEQ